MKQGEGGDCRLVVFKNESDKKQRELPMQCDLELRERDWAVFKECSRVSGIGQGTHIQTLALDALSWGTVREICSDLQRSQDPQVQDFGSDVA